MSKTLILLALLVATPALADSPKTWGEPGCWQAVRNIYQPRDSNAWRSVDTLQFKRDVKRCVETGQLPRH